MNDRRSNLKIAGMILLGLFALIVGVPLLLVAFGAVALTSLLIFAKLVALAIFAIKLAVGIAVVYLIVVGIRAFLKLSKINTTVRPSQIKLGAVE